MEYVKAFVVGGLICVIGQILIDKTKLTPARILVLFVTLGVALTAVGLYEPLVNFAGAGATVPLTGFGNVLWKGMKKAIDEQGFLGLFTGGFTSCAVGVSAALIFGFIYRSTCIKIQWQKLVVKFNLVNFLYISKLAANNINVKTQKSKFNYKE